MEEGARTPEEKAGKQKKDIRRVLFYSDEMAGVEYAPTHPFKPVRARLFLELLHRYYNVHGGDFRVERPGPLDEELLYLFHEKAYIELLRKASRGEFDLEMLHAGLGMEDNPVFLGLFEFALAVAGGTHRGATEIARGDADVVFIPLGGLHHAKKDRAAGFCYINDAAIAIGDCVRKGLRVAYVDVDAHHGDGVQDAFYATDRVLTISVHESGRTLFPGTGFETETGEGAGRGYNVNVPLRAGTDDEVYLAAFEAVVPPLLEWFRADVVFAQIGGDVHKDDYLAHLNLTSRGYKRVVSRIRDLSPRVLAMAEGAITSPRPLRSGPSPGPCSRGSSRRTSSPGSWAA